MTSFLGEIHDLTRDSESIRVPNCTHADSHGPTDSQYCEGLTTVWHDGRGDSADFDSVGPEVDASPERLASFGCEASRSNSVLSLEIFRSGCANYAEAAVACEIRCAWPGVEEELVWPTAVGSAENQFP